MKLIKDQTEFDNIFEERNIQFSNSIKANKATVC